MPVRTWEEPIVNVELICMFIFLHAPSVQNPHAQDHDEVFNVLVTLPHKTIMGCFDSGHLLGIPSLSLPCLDEVIFGSQAPCY